MSELISDELWEPRPLPEGGTFHCRFGPLEFWLRRADTDLILHTRREAAEEIICLVDSAPPPDDVKASERFTYDGPLERVRAVPMLPDRSIVVRPENALKVLNGQKSQFFVSIPIMIRVELMGAAADDALQVTEIMTAVLSNTWFGDTTGGELCYALKTTAKHRLETVTRRKWRAICPVTVVNRSEKSLDLQRICVQSKHLGCYSGEFFLWANAVEVTHRAEKEELHVQFAQEPPSFEKISRQLSEPRDPVKKSFLRRGLSGFRMFAQI
ncbi:MAG: DUF432 domain-containing protein [Opitutales bacterium]|nr:DUF432 domain-containing protein [Opitutales bacterium]